MQTRATHYLMDRLIECVMVWGGMPAYRRPSKPVCFMQPGPYGFRFGAPEGPAAGASW